MRKSLDILGLTFRIERPEHIVDDENRTLDGRINMDKQLIQVAAGLDPEVAAETILHEVLHGLSFRLFAGLKERQVELLTTGLAAFCKANGLKWDLLKP